MQIDWARIAWIVQASRALDAIEESQLLPERKILYQFCARGHELGQSLLGLLLTDAHDGIGAYYRSRPLMLALGFDLQEAAAGPLARDLSSSGGRDIGVVFNMPGRGGATVLPGCGGVGAQYTPAVGWAQAIRYRRDVLHDAEYAKSIAVAHGGDASTATNGFWSSLAVAAPLRLPVLFYIEDNGYGISVPSVLQTPGGDIAANLQSFANLAILSGDGTRPSEAAELTARAVALVRAGEGPALLRLTVPRLSGHSGQDTQTYKSSELLARERAHDPLEQLRRFAVPSIMAEEQWLQIERTARKNVEDAVAGALALPPPSPESLQRHVFCGATPAGGRLLQEQGGVAPDGHEFPGTSTTAVPEPARINMLTAIRRTLDVELATNSRLLVFGEDVGPKGGVHGATLGLQEKYGDGRGFQ